MCVETAVHCGQICLANNEWRVYGCLDLSTFVQSNFQSRLVLLPQLNEDGSPGNELADEILSILESIGSKAKTGERWL